MQEIESKQKHKGASGRAERFLGDLLSGIFRGGGSSGGLPQSGREEKERAGEQMLKEAVGRLRETGKGLLFAGTACLFSHASLPGDVRPFGIAMLCASEVRVPWILAGLLLSAFSDRGSAPIRLVCCLAALLLRVLICRVLGLTTGKLGVRFAEPVSMRAATAAAAGFIQGLYGIFDSGFERSALYSALFLIAAAPAVTVLYSGIRGGEGRFNAGRDLGILSMMFTLILSLEGLRGGVLAPIGFSASVIVSVFLTLSTAFSGGAFRGGLVGMVCGLACGGTLSPVLGISGVIAGTLRHAGTLLPMLAFCGSGAAFSLAAFGIPSFGSTIPDILWGAALFAPAAKMGFLSGIYPFFALSGGEKSMNDLTASRVLTEGRRGLDTERRIAALSEALSSLSSVFHTLSDRIAAPGLHEVRVLCEKTFKGYCAKCPTATLCWGREYERTADIMNKLAHAVARHGCADSEYIPDDFFRRCPSALQAISELNLTHARMLEAAARENRTEVFALDYEAMAKLLASACEESAAEYECDRLLTERVKRAAREMNLNAVGIAVYGRRRKSVVAGGVDIADVKLTSEQMREAFGKACGVRLTLPEFSMEEDYVTMTAVSARSISVESAECSLKKENETVNGDSVCCFGGRDDYFYALISDGMGSGREAAITSRITCIFLEKMLAAGNRKGVVLKMLHQFIRSKNLECFATVDLLEIDLLNGSAAFVKGGAAASYIVREGKLFRISSSSLPIGITREMTAEEIRFGLQEGDLILMISDGVAQSAEEGVWLAELLSSGIDPAAPAEDIAAQILESAKLKNSRSDDMTVAVIRITKEKG